MLKHYLFFTFLFFILPSSFAASDSKPIPEEVSIIYMLTAEEKGGDTFDMVVEKYVVGDLPGEDFQVKVSITPIQGVSEDIWLSSIIFDKEKRQLTGTLSRDPNLGGERYKKGDQIVIRSVLDWRFKEKGKWHGDFTGRVLSLFESKSNELALTHHDKAWPFELEKLDNFSWRGRDTFSIAINKFKDGVLPAESFEIRSDILVTESRREPAWLGMIEYDIKKDVLTGIVLSNLLTTCSQVKKGSRVVIDDIFVADWRFIDEGKWRGNFAARRGLRRPGPALAPRWEVKGRPEIKLHDRALPTDWY